MSSGTTPAKRIFIVHHNPNSGRYTYDADPHDAVASARTLAAAGDSGWVAGNCHRLIRAGDVVLFKFGGTALKQEPGIYAAGVVTRPPRVEGGVRRFGFIGDRRTTSALVRRPIIDRELTRVVPRSFGASIQIVPASRLGRVAIALKRRGAGHLLKPVRQRITHGLIIMKEPLDLILAGQKTWELRGKATVRRGPVALIESKSGHVVGTCDIVDVVGPVSLAELRRKAAEWGSRPTALYYPKTYGWVIANARRLRRPVQYSHPSGAVIWVRLSPAVSRTLGRHARSNQ